MKHYVELMNNLQTVSNRQINARWTPQTGTVIGLGPLQVSFGQLVLDKDNLTIANTVSQSDIAVGDTLALIPFQDANYYCIVGIMREVTI